MEERTASQARFENGRSAARQRGKKRGRGGVRLWKCHAARGDVVGSGPDRCEAPGSDPSVAHVGDVRRAHVAGQKQRGGLTGGSRHSAGQRCR
jgi:hypothetical protein